MTTDLELGATSRTLELDGPLHYLDFGGRDAGTPVVCVHGLGGAAWNFAAVAPRLAEHTRVLAPDLAGHGRTPAAGRSTTVGANRRLLHRFIAEVVQGPAILVGNSMGGLISLMEAAKSPDSVTAVVAIDPALPRGLLTPIDLTVARNFAVMSVPYVGELALARSYRLPPREIVEQTLALCCVDSSRVPEDVVALGVRYADERTRRPEAAKEFLAASRSLVRMLARSKRVRRDLEAVRAPVLLLHGAKDRLVPLKVARAAVRKHPEWSLDVAPDCGHVPMLEMPDWTVERIRAWLSRR